MDWWTGGLVERASAGVATNKAYKSERPLSFAFRHKANRSSNDGSTPPASAQEEGKRTPSHDCCAFALFRSSVPYALALLILTNCPILLQAVENDLYVDEVTSSADSASDSDDYIIEFAGRSASAIVRGMQCPYLGHRHHRAWP